MQKNGTWLGDVHHCTRKYVTGTKLDSPKSTGPSTTIMISQPQTYHWSCANKSHHRFTHLQILEWDSNCHWGIHQYPPVADDSWWFELDFPIEDQKSRALEADCSEISLDGVSDFARASRMLIHQTGRSLKTNDNQWILGRIQIFFDPSTHIMWV